MRGMNFGLHMQDLRQRLGHIPLCFLGLGFFRAWVEILFHGNFVQFRSFGIEAQDVFTVAVMLTCLAVALAARRVGTLFDRPRAQWLMCGLLLASTFGMFATLVYDGLAGVLMVPCALCGGCGIALVIVMWSEFYGCLSPVRVVLYYSGSLVFGAVLIYICQGFLTPWLFVATASMPVALVVSLRHSFAALPVSERPCPAAAKFSFPVKPVALMAIYAFAYGLKDTSMYTGVLGPHSALGCVLVAAAVFAGVLARGERFNFGAMYRVALPLMVVAFLVLPSLGFLNAGLENFCVTASYTAFSILIKLILANLVYRFGMNALWLFGLERAVRTFAVALGRQAQSGFEVLIAQNASFEVALNAAVVLLVVALTMILLSEHELSSRWGVNCFDSGVNDAHVQRQRLLDRCAEVAQEHALSAREEEVLLLLAQGKSISEIERELVIANGTAKAHTRHIYRKLDIHTREELQAKLHSQA